MKRLSISQLRELSGDQIGFLKKMQADFPDGLYQFSVFGTNFYFLTNPDHIRELLIKHNTKTHRDPITKNALLRVTGNGVFIAEEEAWKKQRKLTQPSFHATRIQAYTDDMVGLTQQMMADWKDGETVHLSQSMIGLTLNIIAKTMYGITVERDVERVGHLFQEVLEVAEAQLKRGIPIPEWVPTQSNRKQKRARSEIRELLQEIIQAKRETGEDSGDLLSMLLLATDENGEQLSDLEVLDQCLTLFFAGHETTAGLLTWAWYLLTLYPDVYERLSQEIQSTVGDKPIHFEQIKELPYLEAVLNETLRLYPSAPSFGRTAMEPFNIGATEIPKGSLLFVQIMFLHRRKDIYEDPERFMPERFLDPENRPERYDFLPFGAGPRVCLGSMFAMMEASVVLTTMIQTLNFKLLNSEPVEFDTLVTLRPAVPVMVEVELL